MDITFKIMDHTRRRRIRVKAAGTLLNLIEKVNLSGLQGNIIVGDEDGFQIIDDTDLIANSDKQLMVLTEGQLWTERDLLHKPIYFAVNQDQASTSQAPIKLISVVEEKTSIDNNYFDEEDVNDDTFDDPYITSEEKSKFDEFYIPWDKFPSDLTAELQNKKRFGKNELCLAANIIIAELRQIYPRIRKDVLSRVADEAATAYPDSFLQKDKFGANLSEKPVLFLAKLLSRRNYLNRAPMKKKHTVQNVSRSTKQLRESDRIAETVKNYQPNIIGLESEMMEKRSWLKGVYGTANADLSAEKVIDCMDSTFGLQRFDINENSSMDTIFDKWPFLVVPVHLSRYFKNLTGVNLRNFTDNFHKFKSAIISHLENSNTKEILKLLPGIVSDHVDIRTLKLVCGHFKEDFKYVAQQFPMDTTLQNLTETVKIETPFLAIVETPPKTVFYVFVDGIKVADANTFIGAFQQMLGFYYLLNIKYPMKASLTFEFIQRMLLRIRNNSSRGWKNSPASMAAVLTLICDVNDKSETE